MRKISPLSLQSAAVSVPAGQVLENFSDAGRRDGSHRFDVDGKFSKCFPICSHSKIDPG